MTEDITVQPTDQPTEQPTEEIRRVILVLEGEMRRSEIQDALGLKHTVNFRDNYLLPTIEAQCIEMIYPETPNHPNQRYRLTVKGLEIQKSLRKLRRKKR